MNDTMITFTGWVGGNVELNHTTTGTPVATLRVGSTPRRLKDGTWEDQETIWYSVKAWRTLAENVAASVRRGQPVLVTGRLVAETWDRPDGTSATRHVVVAATIGHDLSRGRADFSRPPRPVEQPAEQPVEEVRQESAA
ncbi:MAG: single-stranded DNA-binding protein [Nocardioides sp.]|nr:single-stranded DNA-binding protein [Nocardioides sp.]